MKRELSKSTAKETKLNDVSGIEFIDLTAEERIELSKKDSFLLYVREGEVCLSSSKRENLLLGRSQMMFITAGDCLQIQANKDTGLLLWSVLDTSLLSEHLELRSTKSRMPSLIDEEAIVLTANKHIVDMLDALVVLLKDGYSHSDYLNTKFTELLLLLRFFYSKELLISIFSPPVNENLSFKRKMMTEFRDVSSVEELAAKMNLSRSCLYRHFKQVMGKSPYQWLNEEKAKLIYAELTLTTKPIKQIWFEQGFLSASYFNQFCRRYLGNTPAMIRKRMLE